MIRFVQFLENGTYLIEVWKHVYRAKDEMALRTQIQIEKLKQNKTFILSSDVHRVEIKTIDNAIIKSITLTFPDEVLNLKGINMEIKTDKIQALDNFTIKSVKDLDDRSESIKAVKNPEEKIKLLTELAEQQQLLLNQIVRDEKTIFPFIKQFNNYRKLAMRGLSMMASSHEMCSIFFILYHLLHKNSEKFKDYLHDFDRLEELFYANSIVHNVPILGYEVFSGSQIVDYCKLTFPATKTKELTISDDIDVYKADKDIKRKNALTIISNLIRNGFSFGNKVEIKWIDDLIIISDNGYGVDEKDIPNLFNIGFSKRDGGHGLGLFLCKEKAQEENCDIYLDSKNKHTELTGASFIYDLKGQYSIKNPKCSML